MNRLWAEETMKCILKKLENTALNIGANFPHVSKTGTYNDEPFSWVSGFWPGILWLAYQQTGKAEYAKYAVEIETKLDIILDGFDMVEHDTGFMWQLSAGANYRLTGNEDSRRRCMKAASFLASRFHLKGNYIQAWNREPGWAIVDCTMNLAQLYWASREIDNPRFAQIADAHAQTVLEYIVRPDGSTNHIVSFDPESGEYIGPLGGQGNAADSAWARGAAWAMYGLALCYHFTGKSVLFRRRKAGMPFFYCQFTGGLRCALGFSRGTSQRYAEGYFGGSVCRVRNAGNCKACAGMRKSVL